MAHSCFWMCTSTKTNIGIECDLAFEFKGQGHSANTAFSLPVNHLVGRKCCKVNNIKTVKATPLNSLS